jgi:MOSC domain-containing protein YiiM
MKKVNKVFKIGISKKKGEKINEINKIKVLSGKGIVGDRNFLENNDLRKQLTLIESENIDYYNRKYNTNFSYVDFRRNIVTKNIKLNDLVGKTFSIGKIIVRGNDLCRPCNELQEKFDINNFIKEFLRRGGLRCEILSSGTISIGEEIKIL